MYRHLDSEKIVQTIELLDRRIRERFPESGLAKVSAELLKTGQESKDRSRWVARPHWELRFLLWFLVVLMAVSLVLAFLRLDLQAHPLTFGEFVQVLESGINDIVFLGAGVFFLVTIETRIKRNRVLSLIHQLRAIAHVIDMHQLPKDPETLEEDYLQTSSSPQRRMTAFELQRYLDYCSEMLAMIGKIAALYVQDFEDTEAVESVNEIEVLTTGLSRKIWQKIMTLQSYRG
ncbi:MAG: hypothetical protein Q8Q08_08225 [Candidatus Omnitrophota bacterium]|nr:hypothetical protein [Candidatus Omnitrophota bacterium]MDZ4242388.1 hypothetical protein [Candidatus Omnitrophota bacterium]